ncbi:MAG TPA: YggT family protein [Armatimonadota bacterium]|nr:YggT family protein [Armatimonadota bacterium]HOS42358.1 YggT family protein [Armatimonadota bacterium]
MAFLLIYILNLLYSALVLLVIAAVVISWLPQARYSPLGQLVTRLTEPLLEPIRRIIKPLRVGRGGRLDLSPMVLLLLAWLLYQLIVNVVFRVLG